MFYGCTNANISSGKGSDASVLSVPYNTSSIAAKVASLTLVESITKVAVGFCPVTGTGVDLNSHDNDIASGLSLIVW